MTLAGWCGVLVPCLQPDNPTTPRTDCSWGRLPQVCQQATLPMNPPTHPPGHPLVLDAPRQLVAEEGKAVRRRLAGLKAGHQ